MTRNQRFVRNDLPYNAADYGRESLGVCESRSFPKCSKESVRYEMVNAMLLNEFLKEHRTVQELKSVVAKQEAVAAQQQKQIEALTAGLQRVSAQLEASKPAAQVVNNP